MDPMMQLQIESHELFAWAIKNIPPPGFLSDVPCSGHKVKKPQKQKKEKIPNATSKSVPLNVREFNDASIAEQLQHYDEAGNGLYGLYNAVSMLDYIRQKIAGAVVPKPLLRPSEVAEKLATAYRQICSVLGIPKTDASIGEAILWIKDFHEMDLKKPNAEFMLIVAKAFKMNFRFYIPIEDSNLVLLGGTSPYVSKFCELLWFDGIYYVRKQESLIWFKRPVQVDVWTDIIKPRIEVEALGPPLEDQDGAGDRKHNVPFVPAVQAGACAMPIVQTQVFGLQTLPVVSGVEKTKLYVDSQAFPPSSADSELSEETAAIVRAAKTVEDWTEFTTQEDYVARTATKSQLPADTLAPTEPGVQVLAAAYAYSSSDEGSTLSERAQYLARIKGQIGDIVRDITGHKPVWTEADNDKVRQAVEDLPFDHGQDTIAIMFEFLKTSMAALWPDSKSGMICSIISPCVSLLHAVGVLVHDFAKGTWNWMLLSAHLAAIGAAIFSIVNAVKTVLDPFMGIKKIITILKMVFDFNEGNPLDVPHASYDNAVVIGKVGLGLVLGSLTLFGYDGKMGAAIRAFNSASSAGDMTGNMVKSVSTFLGYDIAGTEHLKAEACLSLAKLETYLTLPTEKFASLIVEIETYASGLRKFIGAVKDQVDVATINTLVQKINTIDERIRNCRNQWNSREARPAPVGLYLWSKQGGLGKTELARYLPKLLAARVKGFNTKVMDLQPSSAHSPMYCGEHTVFMDEVGADQKGNGPNPLAQMNNIMSGNCTTQPTAHLEGKNQILKPFLVVMASNLSFHELDTGLKPESKDALCTRLVNVEVVDPLFNPNVDNQRANQNHRMADFTHLTFRYERKRGVTVDLNVAALADLLVQRMMANIANHEKTANVQNPVANYTHKIPDRFLVAGPVDSPHAAADSKFALTICGKQGTGKSRTMKPQLIQMFGALSYKVLEPDSHQELLDMLDTAVLYQAQIYLYILDDVYDFNFPDQQDNFFHAYNKASANVRFVFLTNHGPDIRYTRFGKPTPHYDYLQIPLRPGLDRRIGFTPSAGFAEAKVLYCTHAGLFDLTNTPVSMAEVMDLFYGFDNGLVFANKLEVIPTPFPFTADESDCWLEYPSMDGLSPTRVLGDFLCNASLRLKLHMAGIDHVQFLVPDPNVVVAAMIREAYKHYKDLRIYVRIGNHHFFVDSRDFFLGRTVFNWVLQIVDEKDYRMFEQSSGTSMPITPTMIQNVYDRKPPALEDRQLPDFNWYGWKTLQTYCEQDNVAWQTLRVRFPVVLDTFLGRFSASLKTAALTAYDFMRRHPFLSIIFGFSTLLLPKAVSWMYHRFFGEEDVDPLEKRLATEKIYVPACAYCTPGVLSTVCHGSAAYDHPCAKGKKKAKPQFFVGGKKQLVSDIEGTPLEGYRHDIMLRLGKNGFMENEYSTRGSINGVPMTYGYKYNQEGRLEVHMKIDEEYFDEPRAGFSNFADNVINLRCGGFHLYGLALNNNVVRYGTHLGSEGALITTPWPGILVKPVYAHVGNDASYGIFVGPTGSPVQVQKIVSLVDKLPTNAELALASNVVIVDPADGKNMTNLAFKVENTLNPPVCTLGQELLTGIGVGHYAGINVPFLKPGNCGALALADIRNKWKIVGQYSCHRIICGRDLHLFSVPTVEEWNQFCSHIVSDTVCSDSFLQPVNFMQRHHINHQVFMDRDLCQMVTKPERTDYDPDGNFKLLGHVDNRLPVDQTSSKFPLFNFEFENVLGNLKTPALSEVDIINDHADKLYPDRNGLLVAASVRLEACKENISGVGHPMYSRVDHFNGYAEEMGDYWRCKAGFPNVQPMSVEDAIWGNNSVDPLKLDTSTGATFQLLWPGISKKKQVFAAKRGEFIGEAGLYVKQMIEAQWECWKRGDNFIFPHSISYKSECLVRGKEWKKRLINVVDPITCVNQRRLLMPVQKAFDALGMKSPFMLTMDPIADFHLFVKEFLRDKKAWLSLDVSAFDLAVPHEVMLAVAEFFARFSGAGPVMQRMLLRMMRTVTSTATVLGTALYAKDGGVASGASCTSLMDSAAMMLICHFLYILQHSILSPEEYYLEVDSKHTGDDSSMAFRDKDCLNVAQFIADAKDVFGLTITASGDKSDSPQLLTKITEVVHASRTVVELPGFPGFFSGKLKAEAISSALCWTKSRNHAEQLEQLRQVQCELALYPDLIFEKYAKVVVATKLDIQLLRVSAIRREIKERIMVASIEGNKPIIQEDRFFPNLPVEFDNKVKETPSLKNLRDHLKVPATVKPTNNMENSHFRFFREKLILVSSNYDLGEAIEDSPHVSQAYVPDDVTFGDGSRTAVPRITTKYFWVELWRHRRNLDTPKWVEECIAGDPPARGSRRERNFQKWFDIASTYKVAATTKEVGKYIHAIDMLRKHLYSGSTACSEKVATVNTAAPPTMEKTTAGSSSSSGTVVVGVADNPLPSTATALVEEVHATAGVQKANIIYQQPSQVGPELMPQTAVGMNLLTLSGQKIFKQIINVNTGTDQGFLIYEAEVNPWNENILNPHTLAWAKLHKRFYGMLDIHITVVSAATIIGNIKAAFVPATYAGSMEINQSNLDAFNPVEFACNVTGEACIPVAPTAQETALTGVYRDSKQSTFGKLIIMASTRIENSYAQNVSVQVKIGLSLHEGSIYDLPITLDSTAVAPGILAALDFPLDEVFLAVDGSYQDKFTHGHLVTDPGATYSSPDFLTSRSFGAIPIYAGTDAVTALTFQGSVVGGYRVLDPLSTTDGGIKTVPTTIMNARGVYGIVGSNIGDQYGFRQDPAYTEIYNRVNSDADTIKYDNVGFVSTTKVSLAAPTSGTPVITADLTSATTTAVSIVPGQKYVQLDDASRVVSNTYAVIGVKMANTVIVDAVAYNSLQKGTYSIPFSLEGAAKVTLSITNGVKAPAPYRAVRLVPKHAILPAVPVTIEGQTVPVYAAQAESVDIATTSASASGMGSVVTTLTSAAGLLVGEFLRNQYGCFVNGGTDAPFGYLNLSQATTKQTHRFDSLTFPSTIGIRDGFQSRVLATHFYRSMVGGENVANVLTHEEYSACMTGSNARQKLQSCSLPRAAMLLEEETAVKSFASPSNYSRWTQTAARDLNPGWQRTAGYRTLRSAPRSATRVPITLTHGETAEEASQADDKLDNLDSVGSRTLTAPENTPGYKTMMGVSNILGPIGSLLGGIAGDIMTGVTAAKQRQVDLADQANKLKLQKMAQDQAVYQAQVAMTNRVLRAVPAIGDAGRS